MLMVCAFSLSQHVGFVVYIHVRFRKHSMCVFDSTSTEHEHAWNTEHEHAWNTEH
jgi:hypothetical protein